MKLHSHATDKTTDAHTSECDFTSDSLWIIQNSVLHLFLNDPEAMSRPASVHFGCHPSTHHAACRHRTPGVLGLGMPHQLGGQKPSLCL